MHTPLLADDGPIRDRLPFASLVRPLCGLVHSVDSLPHERGTPWFSMAVASLGNLTMTFPHVASATGHDARDEALGGAAADIDPEAAWTRAVAEAAERYCTMVHLEEEFIVASGDELGAAALDLATVPRCSGVEYADPACPLRPPDSTQPIRWVRGYSLIHRCDRYVPAVMTHLYLAPWREEQFWQPISTGVSAHTSVGTALVSAMCELIERDAIALTWLARLPLPRVELDWPLPDVLQPSWTRLSRSLIRQHFFDATTDLGIPTVYGVQLVDGRASLAQYVNCATDFDAAQACAKVIREAAPARAALQHTPDVPVDVADFRRLTDGAVYMGQPDQRAAYDFLVTGSRRRPLSDIRAPALENDGARVRLLVDRLAGLGGDVVAVDLTTDEVRQAGLWVVRVVAPGLMPMSTIQRARFLGHPRLYRYPEQAGYGRLDEARVNPLPQPFA